MRTGDDFYLDGCLSLKRNATCARDQVVALIIGRGNDLVFGFNHTPAGVRDCIDGGCARGALSYADCPSGSDYSNCIGVHAEDDAISAALDADIPTPWRMWVTREPCDRCWRRLEEYDIDRVVYLSSDGTTLAREL